MLYGFAAAQTPTAPGKDAEEAAKLEKEAVEFLRETSGDVSRLRTLENRISFNAELASLMWFHDEKEAKVMYGAVIADFKQLLSQFDSQMNAAEIPGDDDDSPSGGIFGGYGKSKVERKFRIAMAVRKQIAMSLAEHAPDLAYNFFFDSLNLITSPQFRKDTEASDKYFEGQLMQQIAESDAAKAADYGKESIKRGLDNSHIELLKKIYAKDADKGVEFGEAILSLLRSEPKSVKEYYFFESLLSYGGTNFEASKKTGGKKAIYDRNDLHDIAEQFAQYLLDKKDDDIRYSVSAYADLIDKYAPGRGAQIRTRYKQNNPTSISNTYSLSRANAMANTMAYNGANTATGANSNSANEASRIDRERREKAEQEMTEQVKSLGTKPLPKEERDKVVAQARKIISQTPARIKRSLL